MGRDVPGRERMFIEQAFRLRQDFRGGKAKLRPTLLVWTSRLTPTLREAIRALRADRIRAAHRRASMVPRMLTARNNTGIIDAVTIKKSLLKPGPRWCAPLMRESCLPA